MASASAWISLVWIAWTRTSWSVLAPARVRAPSADRKAYAAASPNSSAARTVSDGEPGQPPGRALHAGTRGRRPARQATPQPGGRGGGCLVGVRRGAGVGAGAGCRGGAGRPGGGHDVPPESARASGWVPGVSGPVLGRRVGRPSSSGPRRSPGHQLPQLVDGGRLDLAQSPGVVSDGGLQGVAGEPSVAEAVPPWGAAERLAEPFDRLGHQFVVGTRRELGQDRDELVVGVVVELDRRPEPAGQAGVRGDERRHRCRVAGDDDHEVVTAVLHLLDQGVDGLLAVLVTLGAETGQAVGLVDEQHPTRGGGDGVGRLRRRLAEVAGDQLGAVDLDELTLREQPEGAVDAARPAARRSSCRSPGCR